MKVDADKVFMHQWYIGSKYGTFDEDVSGLPFLVECILICENLYHSLGKQGRGIKCV